MIGYAPSLGLPLPQRRDSRLRGGELLRVIRRGIESLGQFAEQLEQDPNELAGYNGRAVDRRCAEELGPNAFSNDGADQSNVGAQLSECHDNIRAAQRDKAAPETMQERHGTICGSGKLWELGLRHEDAPVVLCRDLPHVGVWQVVHRLQRLRLLKWLTQFRGRQGRNAFVEQAQGPDVASDSVTYDFSIASISARAAAMRSFTMAMRDSSRAAACVTKAACSLAALTRLVRTWSNAARSQAGPLPAFDNFANLASQPAIKAPRLDLAGVPIGIADAAEA
jgi:hypothetical protein